MANLEDLILHWPADVSEHGRGLTVAIPACRPVAAGLRARDEDYHNCHGDPAAVSCKRCLKKLQPLPQDPPTIVVFRRWRKAPYGVIALFPENEADGGGGCLSYEHIGQHCGADYQYVIGATVAAAPEVYAPLLKELQQIGYDNLQVRLRWRRRS